MRERERERKRGRERGREREPKVGEYKNQSSVLKRETLFSTKS
jgi:hypothetical protein